MIRYPTESDFRPTGQLLVRKGLAWDVIYLSQFKEAEKQGRLAIMFYNVAEWRRIPEDDPNAVKRD